MRSFITLEFDLETKRALLELQEKIRENSIRGRFKYIDNFHMTLKFLGETDKETINKLHMELDERLRGFNVFDVYLRELNYFGRGDKINTIFVKVQDKEKNILKLEGIVDDAAFKAGFKREEKFVPHVTIAQDIQLKRSFSEINESIGKNFNRRVVFDKVTIMKSQEIGGKRVYTPINIIRLEGKEGSYDYK